jgi:hypothetical protein
MDDHILTALVLILSNQLDTQARARGGTQQVGSDYTQEAVRLIQEKQASILGLFGQRAGL